MRRPLAARSALVSPPHATGSIGPALPSAVASSLRSACEALAASPEDLASVSVVSHLPEGTVITRVIDFTERLASEFGCRAHLSVHDHSLDVRFVRQPPDARDG